MQHNCNHFGKLQRAAVSLFLRKVQTSNSMVFYIPVCDMAAGNLLDL